MLEEVCIKLTTNYGLRWQRGGTAQPLGGWLDMVFWRKTDELWWPGGPTDPDVCLLRIEPLTAELWDGPASAAIAAFEFAKARLTGEEPRLGENRKVTVGMER